MTKPVVPATSTAGVYVLAAEHAEAIQRFAADETFAALVGVACPPPPDAGRRMIERTEAERVAGTSFWSIVIDRREAKGVAALIDPYGAEPRLEAWIDPAVRGHGYGTLAVRLTLDLAFRNLQLARVHVRAPGADLATDRTLQTFGFTMVDESSGGGPNVPARWVLTRDAWIAHRDGPVLAALHPDLRVILDAELAAGNEVVETGGGWPDADSLFVRLRDSFRTTPSPLPDGVVYTEPNDPHWWKADYTSRSPRHTLAC